ncbi:MAG: protein kinase [Candidatus Solibacter sp.]
MSSQQVIAEEPGRILLVDDDSNNLELLRNTLDGKGYRLFVARNGGEALKVAGRVKPLLVLLDVMMPGIDGYETCSRLKSDPETRDVAVIFLSSLDETKDKVRGLEVGAVDFITKPFQREEVIARVHTHMTVQRLRYQLESRNRELARELAVAQELQSDARQRVSGPLLGDSPAIRALRESITRHAATAETLLITGPLGAGEEATARAIHHESARGRQAFIHVNCAFLPTGPDPGILSRAEIPSCMSKLELADRGTLYFEEVQKLSSELQQQLAETLATVDGQRERGESAVPDVRFIAYCSAPLTTTSGFHPKLLAHLERTQLRVPALAERVDDIPDLANFFVAQYARRTGAVVESISGESMKLLRRYHWSGDVRELQTVTERAVMSARTRTLEIDKTLLDEGVPLGLYRLTEKLGEGGMGEVWRAKHQLLSRPCAVKLIRTELLGESRRDATIERFRREARIIAQLTSQNTVKLYDFGVSDTGSLYFVMELLEGMDLFSLVESYGPMPAERVVDVLRQACRSLGEAHRAGMLHRDIKPHNIFLCRLGLDFDVVKVLDFGLAKSMLGEDSNLTADGSIIGTPAYMSPERVIGSESEERSDLYALGCVAYWMLTGQQVFPGEPMAVMLHHVRTAPKAPSAVSPNPIPAELDRIVLACLEKEPGKRPASAVELWRLLGEVPVANSWTQDRAATWWSEHLPNLVTPSHPQSFVSGCETL